MEAWLLATDPDQIKLKNILLVLQPALISFLLYEKLINSFAQTFTDFESLLSLVRLP
jgi:hypothetical protein